MSVVAETGPTWVEAWTPAEGAARASALLREQWGVEHTCTWSAPGRVTVIGEHTDYSEGLALPTITPHAIYVAARPREDRRVRVVTDLGDLVEGPGPIWEGDLDMSPQEVDGWPRYVLGLLWALQERGFDGAGMDLAFASCLPPRAGLGSSASILAATALVANDIWRLALGGDEGRAELADACLDAENLAVGTLCGALDPHTILRCGPDEALLLDFADHPTSAVPYPMYFRDYGLGLLVIDTQKPRGDVQQLFRTRRAECAAAAEALGSTTLREVADAPLAARRVEGIMDPTLRRRARHVTAEIERVRLVVNELGGTGPAHERFVAIGKAIYRSHASLELDYEASDPTLDMAVEAAFRAGALGARVSGAGYGGAVVALVRKAQARLAALHIAHGFVDAGMREPRFLWV
ncbi:galactokinase [Demequina zhanjiangensis]|uniref:Galactokinase family protein n=1 Tax=Demequina zhanjiangensis TaxID=3051659 RepID=A0ABT8FXU0_9MICO|nr:galactokinase family protein [Demequina sp. SYSU T00b26]MDN4471627.1 galactokinase family protein [Demequina sp. SYSU T00b26]